MLVSIDLARFLRGRFQPLSLNFELIIGSEMKAAFTVFSQFLKAGPGGLLLIFHKIMYILRNSRHCSIDPILPVVAPSELCKMAEFCSTHCYRLAPCTLDTLVVADANFAHHVCWVFCDRL